MFCPECGNRCPDGAKFCAMCGTKLPIVETPAPSAAPEPKKVESRPQGAEAKPTTPPKPSTTPSPNSWRPPMSGSEREKELKVDGAILTNSEALARKLGCRREDVKRLVEAYAIAALARGIKYVVLDAAEYYMLNPQSSGERVSLTPSHTWVEHTMLLADYYRYGRLRKDECSCYLFIIGGEDIIPMPVVRHYMATTPNFHDKDIDTDIPYAYMLGEKTYPLLESGKLFSYEQYFHVGRLPFATDATIEDFAGYLRRASAAAGGIAVDSYYGQTNFPWGDESLVVCRPLRDAQIPTSSSEFESAYYEGEGERYYVAKEGLVYSLPVNVSNLEQFFDPNASFYYFNLHGSNSPTYSGYIADHVGNAILPQHIATTTTPNIFVTEACYGGRFQRYAKRESMLLSAMSSQTLLFLGSSRIAFCNNRYSIDNSDRLANVFIVEMLSGVSAGEALYNARKSFFEYDNGRLYDQQLVSIVEFNLFGDPSLCMQRTTGKGLESKPCQPLSKSPVNRVVENKCLYTNDDKEAAPTSILGLVRREVDQNLMRIRQTIDSELYDRLGVEHRSLKNIFESRFADGRSFYTFNYADERAGFERSYSALTTPEGEVITVISTK